MFAFLSTSKRLKSKNKPKIFNSIVNKIPIPNETQKTVVEIVEVPIKTIFEINKEKIEIIDVIDILIKV